MFKIELLKQNRLLIDHYNRYKKQAIDLINIYLSGREVSLKHYIDFKVKVKGRKLY